MKRLVKNYLYKRFDKISFVGSDVALAKYLNPSFIATGKNRKGIHYRFSHLGAITVSTRL